VIASVHCYIHVVCFVIRSYPFFVGIRGSVTHFSELGVTLPISRMS